MKHWIVPALAVLAAASVTGADAGMAGMSMDAAPGQALPAQSGQSAFAAIHEIVGILEADPKTDWSRVNIDALRQHLVDMNNVTLYARVTYTPSANGEQMHISGDGAVADSIRRMVGMHMAMAGDTPYWHLDAAPAPDGMLVNVTARSPQGLARIKALGFFGMLAEGSHHAVHHMMLARGAM